MRADDRRLVGCLTGRFGEEPLRYAILLSLGFYLLAAMLMALAARHLARDWIA